jgi:predicted NAD/FAD-binding protein
VTRRIAVVGSGVAGLTAAHVLARSAHVTLFEADSRLGGHAYTHLVDGLAIDTGFIVHNEGTYPTLMRLFAELGVSTQESEMSMSVSDRGTGLEWAGALGLRGVLPTISTLARPAYLRMLAEIPRFHRRARRVIIDSSVVEPVEMTTLREFLAEGRFSAYFTRHFLEPLVAAVWSCDPAQALDYPARYLFEFLDHRGMLSVFGSPTWRTVTGGSREYVARLAALLPDVRTGTKVTSVSELADRVDVTDGNGAVTSYDAVVVATHPAQALSMLESPTADIARCCRRSPSLTPRLSCTPTSRCCPLPSGPGRPGTFAGQPEHAARTAMFFPFPLPPFRERSAIAPRIVSFRPSRERNRRLEGPNLTTRGAELDHSRGGGVREPTHDR